MSMFLISRVNNVFNTVTIADSYSELGSINISISSRPKTLTNKGAISCLNCFPTLWPWEVSSGNRLKPPDAVSSHPRSFIPLVDFIGKVQKDWVREVLSVSGNEFLQPLVALVLVCAVERRHLQGVVQHFDSLHAFAVVTPVACLRRNWTLSSVMLNIWYVHLLSTQADMDRQGLDNIVRTTMK